MERPPGLQQSRFATIQDILDLAAVNGISGQASPESSLDFESSRVIIVNTKGRRSARKRSLSVSPRLSSRGSEASSSSSVNSSAPKSYEETGPGAAGALYNWMQSSLRRRLRKRVRKSAHLSQGHCHQACGATHQLSYQQQQQEDAMPDAGSEQFAYVNHRNGSVTAVPLGHIQKAVSGSKVLAHSSRPRSRPRPDSLGSRLNTRVPRSNSINTREVQSTKPGKTKNKKRQRVLGGAWGLFHCVGAGARSRSCTPERHVNNRVRSRSATPERYINVRVNVSPSGETAGMKGRSKSKSRRRGDVETDDYDKENRYDMWGFIKDRLEGRKTCCSERVSRRDTLTCRPRASVNINRDSGGLDFSAPEPPAISRSASEKRYSQRLTPVESATHTYVHRVPPSEVYFNNCGSVPLQYGAPQVVSERGLALQVVDYQLEAIPDDRSTYGAGASSLPSRYRNRPLPPIPNSTGVGPAKPRESGIHLAKVLKLDKFMKSKWISGIAVTRKNELVVVDLKEAHLIDEDGNLKRNIGTGKGPNNLKEPIDVAVMPNGNLVFSDHADQEVKIYNPKGQFLRKIKDKCLANIAGVATSDKRQIYIAGTDKRCITVHSEDDGLLCTIPDKDSSTASKSTFEHPYSIAVNPLTGDVIIGDDYKQLVVAVSGDGRVLWRYCPTGERHFFPCSIAVDTEGYIFIADLYNEKIYMLDSSGKFLKTLLSRGDGLKGGPGAIAVDGRGHLIVADEERTLRVFKYSDNGFAMHRRFSLNPAAI